jgi:hypothetical protein
LARRANNTAAHESGFVPRSTKISQPLISTAQAKCEDGTRKTRRAIYNVVQHPPAMNTSVDQETRMFTPPPLDPNYHGSNGG